MVEEAWHPVGRERHPSFTRGKVRFEGPSNSEGPVCTIVLPHLGSCQILVRDRPTCCRHILELRKIVTLDQGVGVKPAAECRASQDQRTTLCEFGGTSPFP